MSESVEERVLRVIATTKRLPREKVQVGSTFEELGVDSLDRLNILFDLESEFDIEIDDEQARKVTNIREMITGIEMLLARKAGGGGEPAPAAAEQPPAAIAERGELESGAEDLDEAAGAPEAPSE